MNRIKQQAGNSVNIYLYGDIADYWWDDESNSAKCLKDKLAEMNDVTEINLHINSLGGDVIEGIAMFNLLKQHPAKVNVYIDGFACSIASVIAMAGDTVYMPKNSMMMIHNCWTCTNGNAKDLRKTADDLDKIMEASIESYLSKINISREELVELLDAETYLTADECYEMGFADALLPISESIEQSATQSILQLVKENKELKQKNINVIELDEKTIKTIVKEISKELIKGSAKEEPIGIIEGFQKEKDQKNNIFESFFYAILKEEK